jgi:hypothetical protein
LHLHLSYSVFCAGDVEEDKSKTVTEQPTAITREGSAAGFTHHAEAVFDGRETYGPAGFRGLFSSPYVVLCAAFSTIGGLIFGYDQGVVSVVLVMPQFLENFHVSTVEEGTLGRAF